MKISELIRYIENTASYDQLLVFYNNVDPEYTTEGWECIDGTIGDYRAPFVGYITLSFKPSDSGVFLYREDFINWLKSVKQDYGNQKIHIRLFRGSASKELLDDNLWGHVSTQDGIYYEVTSSPERESAQDLISSAWSNTSGFPCQKQTLRFVRKVSNENDTKYP